MMNGKYFILGVLSCVFTAFAAGATVCYLPDEECNKVAEYDATMYSSTYGYYNGNEIPDGYDCQKVDGMDNVYRCNPDECIEQGYTYIGLKQNEDAWDYTPCPKNFSSTDSRLFYRREPKPCAEGYSTSVQAEQCLKGFETSHNSGDAVCGRCTESKIDTCARGVAEANFPKGCYSCQKNGLKDNDNKDCYDCQLLTDYQTTHQNDCVKGWEAVTAADKSICYKAIDYKTKEEAGCHKSDYNAGKCTCTGENDNCPSGYFKNIYGNCPGGSALISKSGCVTCAVEVCNGEESQTSELQKGADDTDSDGVTKRSYVDGNGKICTEVCTGEHNYLKCSTTCVSDNPREGASSTNCSYKSIYSGRGTVFGK